LLIGQSHNFCDFLHIKKKYRSNSAKSLNFKADFVHYYSFMAYKTKPAKDKRLREKIGELRHRRFKVNIWHYGARYVKGWYEKIRKITKK
jgi:hypothetical protein